MSILSINKANKVLFVIPALAIQLLASGFVDASAQETTPSKGITTTQKEIAFFNKDIIKIQAGDTKIVNQLMNSINESSVSLTLNPVQEKNDAPNTIKYIVGEYKVTFENLDLTTAGQQDIYMYLENGDSSNISDQYKLNAIDTKDDKTEITGVINTYRLNVLVEDQSKPMIELSETNVELEVDDEFNPYDYITRSYDIVDGDIPYTIDSNVDTSTAGEYRVTYQSVDKNGNVSTATLNVIVNQVVEEVSATSRSINVSANSSASAYELLSMINSARAQLGVAPLSLDTGSLGSAAQLRANEASTYLSHTRPDGTYFSSVFPQFGIYTNVWTENLVKAGSSPSAAIGWWRTSSFHWSALMNPKFHSIGLGNVGDVWTALMIG